MVVETAQKFCGPRFVPIANGLMSLFGRRRSTGHDAHASYLPPPPSSSTLVIFVTPTCSVDGAMMHFHLESSMRRPQ